MGTAIAEWIDITSGLDALLWASAEDIAIDPENPDRIWITFQNFSDGQKVYHSPNGGTTWINQSLNLPNMPVNCIEYHTGTNDGLYIGTDVGLFYKDASMSEWKCLNSGQPALLVTDIEVDYCINKLIVSTFGRGVYRTSLVEEETFTSILTDRLIDIPTVSQGGMVIEPGVTLTVTSDLTWRKCTNNRQTKC